MDKGSARRREVSRWSVVGRSWWWSCGFVVAAAADFPSSFPSSSPGSREPPPGLVPLVSGSRWTGSSLRVGWYLSKASGQLGQLLRCDGAVGPVPQDRDAAGLAGCAAARPSPSPRPWLLSLPLHLSW